MRHPLHRSALAAALVLLAACAGDATTAPRLAPPSAAPARLLGPDESMRTITDTTDARGVHTMVAEYAAGVLTAADGSSSTVGSVTIRTVIPASNASGSCITSSIVAVETIDGWSSSVKKPGGCDKEIVVALENRASGQKAQFSFLYVFGKTRIDFGAVR